MKVSLYGKIQTNAFNNKNTKIIISEIVKKGIAVDTIILIILGVVVLGLVGYLIYKNAGGLANTTEKCKAQALIYCDEWKETNFNTDPFPDKSDTENRWYKTYTSCITINFAWPEGSTTCRALLGIEEP